MHGYPKIPAKYWKTSREEKLGNKSEQMPWEDNTAKTSYLSTQIKQCFL
jgi:hypothetical protein